MLKDSCKILINNLSLTAVLNNLWLEMSVRNPMIHIAKQVRQLRKKTSQIGQSNLILFHCSCGFIETLFTCSLNNSMSAVRNSLIYMQINSVYIDMLMTLCYKIKIFTKLTHEARHAINGSQGQHPQWLAWNKFHSLVCQWGCFRLEMIAILYDYLQTK